MIEQRERGAPLSSQHLGVSRPLTEGDIALPPGRNARKCSSCKWSIVDGVVNVPIVLNSGFTDSDKTFIRSALEEFSTVTCIRFIDRSSEKDYITIQNNTGCWSVIGKFGGVQTLNLESPSCMKYGVIQHEAMHSLSFFHEHTRPDRDNFVDIMWNYISPENQADFKKNDRNTLQLPYDYNSVMHYGRYTFSNTSLKPSVVPKPDPMVFIGQRDGLSGQDVAKINKFYACNLCRTKFLGPSGNFSSINASTPRVNDSCIWLLHVPISKVFLRFTSFSSSSKNCNAKINVYDGVSKAKPILATIRPNETYPVFISSGPFMVVEYVPIKSCASSFYASYETVMYGNTYTAYNGSVVSPKYPSFYPSSAKDISVIIAPIGFKVSVNFTLFDIESSPNCTSDVLLIRNGGDINSSVLGKYCGRKTTLSLLSSGRMMLFQFSSDTQTNRKGYKADYTFVSSK
ncbi:astacin-like metalloendopeptidase isoform X2 [Hyla sarda]|uniref:astacin-like metalloendopeptidase isoform X2 n=1 Tax=Hyla sarda TaxID=327740 RepID=UPI0024C3D224|nr:astacin-like metalloendopeptidase isoform X2 [Hyla sarda]